MTMISMCGLNCSTCPCFLARNNDDRELRKKTAEKWKVKFGWSDLKSEDINCTGCLSSKEPHFKNCDQCEVRKCGLEKKHKNCGQCDNYANCSKIISLHKMIPHGRKTCDSIKNKA